MTTSMVVRDVRIAPQTIEVWTPNNGEPVTVNVGRHICDDWYYYVRAVTALADQVKLRSVSSGRDNPDELDGLFTRLKQIPQLQRFSVERDTISLWLNPHVQWRNVQPHVEQAITQLPAFRGSRPSFRVQI